MEIDSRKVVHVACNICGADNYSILWVKDVFHYVRCRDCGLIYITPRLTEEEIANIYSLGFKSKSLQKPMPLDFSSYSPFFKQIERYRKNNTLLDIGCFRGYLLMGAGERNWQVFGTEISVQAAQEAANSGIKVYVGSVLDAHYPNDYFDVVSLFDVIEHLADPLGYLREIRRILRPGGLIYLDTPNFNSIIRFLFKQEWSVFFPWHLYYFTPNTIKTISEKAELKLISCKCENWGPISKYNPYLALNSNFAISKPGIVSRKFVQKYRKLLKPSYLWARSIANIPLRILARLGIYAGSKLIVLAEKKK